MEGFSPDQLQQIVESEPDAQILVKPIADELRITHANEAARDLLGDPVAMPDVRVIVSSCWSSWREGANSTLTDIRWPGMHRWFDVRVRALYGQVCLTFTDVTQRHDATDALMDSQCRYRLLAENAGDLVFQVRGKRVEWVSSSVRQLLGWDQSEIVGRRVAELVHPEDRASVMEACEIDAKAARYDARFRHRDGSWLWLSVAMRPAQDLGGCTARIGSGRAIPEQAIATHL